MQSLGQPAVAIAGVGVTAAGSVVVDAATGGLNILATPAELAFGAAIGGSIGYGLGSVVDRVTGSGESGPIATPEPTEMSKGGKSQGRNWATEQAKNNAQTNGTDPCRELAKMLDDAKCGTDSKKVRDIEQAQKFLHCRDVRKRDSHY